MLARMSNPVDHEAWLRAFVQQNGAVAGTIHLLGSQAPQTLALNAAVNIPPKVREIVAVIPRGKGMAGLAWERDEPVHTCNLKTDASGDVRPGAKAVDANAAVVDRDRVHGRARHHAGRARRADGRGRGAALVDGRRGRYGGSVT